MFVDQQLKTNRDYLKDDSHNLKSCSLHKPVQSPTNFPQLSSRPKQTIDVTSGIDKLS